MERTQPLEGLARLLELDDGADLLDDVELLLDALDDAAGFRHVCLAPDLSAHIPEWKAMQSAHASDRSNARVVQMSQFLCQACADEHSFNHRGRPSGEPPRAQARRRRRPAPGRRSSRA